MSPVQAEDKRPVVLVPGAFGQNLLYWNAWQRLLRRDGHPVHSITFPRFTLTDLRVSAEYLSEKVADVLDEGGHDRVHLVSHSMGGLISRLYLQEMNGRRDVESLACMGVPHHGTWTALTAPVLKGCRQILPGSEFLRRLNDPQRMRASVPTLNLWSLLDVIVFPATHARLKMPGVDNHCVKHTGHWAMLVSPWVYWRVKRHMDMAAGELPPPVASPRPVLPQMDAKGSAGALA